MVSVSHNELREHVCTGAHTTCSITWTTEKQCEFTIADVYICRWIFTNQIQNIRINSLGPSDVTWRHRSGSTFAQVMACCLTAPSHYLNQCWLIIGKVKRHSSKRSSDIHLRASSQEITQPSITEIIWKIKYLEFHSNFSGANELKLPVWSHVIVWRTQPA